MHIVYARSVAACLCVCVSSPVLHSSHLRSADGSQLSFTSPSRPSPVSPAGCSAAVLFVFSWVWIILLNESGVEQRSARWSGVGWGGGSLLWRTADSPVGNSADASQTRAKLEKWIWPFPMWETKKNKSMNGPQLVLQHLSSFLLATFQRQTLTRGVYLLSFSFVITLFG